MQASSVWMFAEFNAPQPIFGMALGSHLERSCRDIASVLEDCVTALLDYGLEEEVWNDVVAAHIAVALSVHCQLQGRSWGMFWVLKHTRCDVSCKGTLGKVR